MRAAIYKRVSTDEQIEGFSLDGQEADCRAYAARHGWTIVDVYADEGLSGRREDRPALIRLRAAAAARRFDVVLVYKLDRLARNSRLQLQIAEELDKLRIRLVSVTEPMAFTGSSGRFSLSMLAGAAQFFSDRTSEDVSARLATKAAGGGWIGPVPLGYLKDADGSLIASPDADAVRLIFQLYASGQHSYTATADELNRRGWRTLDWRTGERRLFGRESVRTILKNRAYLGFVSSGGIEYPGRHTPLIDAATWDAVQHWMAERTSWHGVPIARSDAWLTGRLWCEQCGRKIWHQISGNAQPYRYYRCSGHSNRVCTAPMIPAAQLEDDVLAILGRLTIPPAFYEEVLADTERYLAALNQPTSIVVDRAAVEQKLSRLARLYADNLIDDGTYERERDALKGQLELATTTAMLRFDAARAAANLADLPTLLAQATPPERRTVVQSVFERIWINNRTLSGLTPRAEVYPLLRSISRCVDGVADGTRTHNNRNHNPALCH